MRNAKNKRQIRNDSKQRISGSQTGETLVPIKNAVKKLSFSFYGEDTLKKGKQVILDDCDFLQ